MHCVDCGKETNNTKTLVTNPLENSRVVTIAICVDCDNITFCELCGYPVKKDGAYTIVDNKNFYHLDCYEKKSCQEKV